MRGKQVQLPAVHFIFRFLVPIDFRAPAVEDFISKNFENQVEFRWAQLRDMVDQKRSELDQAHRLETFRIDCQETISWIEDKTRVLEDADELTNDLTGVMKLQRRLSMMERDLGAIQVCNQFPNQNILKNP